MYLLVKLAFGLRTGDTIKGKIRSPKDGERYFAILKIEEINFEEPDKTKNKPSFENLTPLFPDERMLFELGTGSTEDLSSRVIDLTAYWKRTRSLIVSPPSGQNLTATKHSSFNKRNNPECKIMVLLVDERPEEVTEMKRSVKGEVIASTFDEAPTRHVKLPRWQLTKLEDWLNTNMML